MFDYHKYGTYVLEFIYERSKDHMLSSATHSISTFLKTSKISYEDFINIIKNYPGVEIYNSDIIWINNETEVKALTEELNILITITGTRIIF